MGYNVSRWRTDAPNQVGYWVGYQFWTPGQAIGAQFAQAKPEGAVVDGTQNWSPTSYNYNIYLEYNIYLDVASQRIGYSFLVGSTSGRDLSLCGDGLG
jgi:hypothetical protein